MVVKANLRPVYILTSGDKKLKMYSCQVRKNKVYSSEIK